MSEHFISRADAESNLLACATYLAESIESADGHAEAISGVVPRYLAKGDVDLAAELANTVDDPFTRDRLLIHIAEKCAETGDDEYAIQLIEAIEEPGMQAEGRERIGMLEAGKGNFDAARRIADDMAHPDFVLAAIASKQFSAGERDAFDATLKEIEFPSARVSARTGLAHIAVEKGESESILELLDAAAVDAAEIEHDEERIRAFVEIGTLFIEAKQNGRAIETFDKARENAELLDNVHRDAFLATVSVGFLRAGSQDLSDRALDLVADKTQIATCLLGHARHYWGLEQKDDAFESLEEAYAILKSQRDIETRSSKERYKLFGAIAMQFALFGKGERAIETAEAIEDEAESMSALAQIAVIFAGRGDEPHSQRALNAIPDDAHRTFALIGISDAVETVGNREAAVAHLDEAAHLAETVPQLPSRASAYLEIAKRFAKFEAADNFDSAIAKAIDAVTAIKDESIKVASLIDLDRIIEELKLDIGPEDLDFLKTILRDIPVE